MQEPAVIKESKFLPYEYNVLSENILNVAKKELGETDEVRKRCLQNLRERISGTENLTSRMDDEFLLRFLRVAKFNVDVAFGKLQKYYRVRKKYPQVFQELYPSSTLEQRKKEETHFLLPYRNSDNSVIFVHKMGLFDPKTVDLEAYLKIDAMLVEIALENPVTQINGITIIFDFEGMPFSVITLCTPWNIMYFNNFAMNSLIIRYKRLHIVNISPIVRALYHTFSGFIPKKIKDRIFIHPNGNGWKSLHSHVPPEILPSEYGGKLGPLDYSVLQNMLEEREDMFKEHLKYGYRV